VLINDTSPPSTPISDSKVSQGCWHEGLKPKGNVLANKVLQLTDPACHGPGGCNRTAPVLFSISASIDLGGMLVTPGPRQSGPQLKTTIA
jgi:hypothetical protein